MKPLHCCRVKKTCCCLLSAARTQNCEDAKPLSILLITNAVASTILRSGGRGAGKEIMQDYTSTHPLV